MKQYLDLMRRVRETGTFKADRTGTGTYSVFGHQMRFDLADGFPLVTTKKMFVPGMIDELLWFISGSTNVNDLPERTQKWWTPWQSADGELGPIYGEQYRRARWWFRVKPDIRHMGEIKREEDLFCGVGRLGYSSRMRGQSEDMRLLKNTWRDMLKRCYDRNSKAYSSYGAKGVHVCESWLHFDNFMRDAVKLPGWNMKRMWPDEYSIDKDIRRAANYYSPETCMWASHHEQSCNLSNSRPFYATAPNGKEILFASISEMCDIVGTNQSAVHRCLNGALHTHHGWSKFRYVDSDGSVMRFRELDQLKNLVANIVFDPDSRRHMVNLWNSPAMDHANLPCCHGSVIQFYVAGGKLHSHVYQRSVDVIVGLPVNLASYALLNMMLAQVVGMAPGEFVWTGGDCHLYSNHLEQADLQLTRAPLPLPVMRINPDVTDLFAFRFEDFELVGYQAHPHIKGEVAV